MCVCQLDSGGIINTEKSEGITRPGDIGMNTNSAKAKEEFYSKVLGTVLIRKEGPIIRVMMMY